MTRGGAAVELVGLRKRFGDLGAVEDLTLALGWLGPATLAQERKVVVVSWGGAPASSPTTRSSRSSPTGTSTR